MIAIISNVELPFNTENGSKGFIRRRIGFVQIPESRTGYEIQVIDECLDKDDNVIDKKSPRVSSYTNEEIDTLLSFVQPLIDTIEGNIRVKLNEGFYQSLLMETKSEIRDSAGNKTGRYRYSEDATVWVRYEEKEIIKPVNNPGGLS